MFFVQKITFKPELCLLSFFFFDFLLSRTDKISNIFVLLIFQIMVFSVFPSSSGHHLNRGFYQWLVVSTRKLFKEKK